MKALKIIGVIILFAAIGVLSFFLYKSGGEKKILEAEKQSLIGQMNQMQSSFSETKIETKTVYKYGKSIPSGAEVTADDVVAVEIAVATTKAYLMQCFVLIVVTDFNR